MMGSQSYSNTTACPEAPHVIDEPEIEPPEGGLKAWLAVVACFFTTMNTWGVIISFGVFQTYYVSALDRPRSDIAWVGSLAVFLLFFGGLVSGRLTDTGHFHHASIAGAFLLVLGTFMASLGTEFYQIILAQGICTGIGNGLLVTPMMTLLTMYFKRRLPLVMGVAACGSTTGGLVYPSIARTMLPKVGFGWTMRTIGFVQTATLIVALLSGKPRAVNKSSGVAQTSSATNRSIFRETIFVAYLFASFLTFLGIFVPFFYLSSYAREKRGMSYTESMNLTLVLNGIGFISRLAPGILARYLGTLNTFIIHVLASAICMFTWIPVNSISGLYVWTVFYSVSFGGVQSLFLPVLPLVSRDMANIGLRIGVISAAVGVGALLGSPVSGAIISAGGGSYTGAQAFSGTVMAAGGLLTMWIREATRRKEQKPFKSVI